MTLMRKVQLSLTIPFLIYFGLYAVSPLSYAFRATSASLSPDALSSPGSFNIYFLELVLSQLSPKSGPQEQDRDARILLRRLRAVLPEKTTVKSLSSEAPAPPDVCIPSSSHVFAESAWRNFQSMVPIGFNPLYSGHSPPVSA